MSSQARDEMGRYVTSGQPDVVHLITQAYAERQAQEAAAPLTDEELRLVDRVAADVLAEEAQQQARQQHGEFLSSVLFPEAEADNADS
jgi:hypothetical protein